jgi:hypothetical protein
MKTRLTFLMAVVLLLGLVFSGPAQTVTAEATDGTTAVTISPDTLADVVYGTYTTQYLTATRDEEHVDVPIWLSVTGGNLPRGITLYSYQNVNPIGSLYGAPEETGDFTFTLEAHDFQGNLLGTRAYYDWHVAKATPVVTFVLVQTYSLQSPPTTR